MITLLKNRYTRYNFYSLLSSVALHGIIVFAACIKCTTPKASGYNSKCGVIKASLVPMYTASYVSQKNHNHDKQDKNPVDTVVNLPASPSNESNAANKQNKAINATLATLNTSNNADQQKNLAKSKKDIKNSSTISRPQPTITQKKTNSVVIQSTPNNKTKNTTQNSTDSKPSTAAVSKTPVSQNKTNLTSQQKNISNSQYESLDQYFHQLASENYTGPSTGDANIPMEKRQQYAMQIKNVIQQNLINDHNFHGKYCEIRLQIAEDGLILKAQIKNGDPVLCAAALRAIGITNRVPKPENQAIFEEFKNIVVKFEF